MTLPTILPQLTSLTIPSPSDGVWNLGPVPLRGYALCIIAGIIFAIWFGERRWVARGGRPGEVQDLAVWAVPFGVVGARLYHVATDWEKYFGEGGNPWQALYIWKGGLGIWGAVALGALGVWIWSRRKGVRLLPMLDVLAPGVIVAQAMGRWGNWFNQELYGKPTDLPWGLEIDRDNWPTQCDYPKGTGTCLEGYPDSTVFHPTFLYEAIWNLGIFGLLLWAERRFKLGFGRVFALYVMGYTLGRGWIEYLRIDDVQLENVLGLRFNVWTSIVLFVVALVYFVVSSRRHPGREDSVYRDGFGPDAHTLDGVGGTDGDEPGSATDEATDEATDGATDGVSDGGATDVDLAKRGSDTGAAEVDPPR